jgi:hypothetical protein
MAQEGEILAPEAPRPQEAPNGHPRCGAPTVRRGICTAPGTMPDGRCPHHSVTISEAQKRSWRQRGQKASMRARLPIEFAPADFSTEEGARRALEQAADLVRAGQMPTSVANALAKIAGVALKASELRLAAQVAEIERQLREQGAVPRRSR